MDGRRFDQLTQTLARRLRQDGSAEFGGPARPAGQLAPRAAPEALSTSGTCPCQELTAAAPGRDDQGGAPAVGICSWEHPPVVPATNDGRLPSRTSRSARHQRAQPLSAREQEIAGLIMQGLKDREIAAALVLSEHTVHAHV